MAAGLFIGVEDVQHAVSLAGAQIAYEESAVLLQLVQGRHMALGQVHHMDVVPHAGAVMGGPVAAEDVEAFQLSRRHLGDIGHQIIGNAVGVLADFPGGMGADGVEVTQERHVQIGVCRAAVGENPFQHQLGVAVGIGGRTGGVLPDGHRLGVAVDGSRRGKDKIAHSVLTHHIEHRQGIGQVIGVILQRLAHALPHRLEGGKVNDGLNVRVGIKEGLGGPAVAQIRFHKGHRLPGDLLHPPEGFPAGVDQVVGHYYVIARLQQGHAGMGANVSRAAADQNLHLFRFLSILPLREATPIA